MVSTYDRLEHAGDRDRDRLLLRGQELHAGDPLEVLVRDAWVPARVEWSPTLGWYALARQAKNDHLASSRVRGVTSRGSGDRPVARVRPIPDP